MQISARMRVAGDVDQQVPEDPSTSQAFAPAGIGNLAQRDLELVELVLARLVEPAPGWSGR